jgi:hypothetical protein
MGKVFKVVLDMPDRFGKEVSEYVVGAKEKDFLVEVFKGRVIRVEELIIEYSRGVLFTQ